MAEDPAKSPHPEQPQHPEQSEQSEHPRHPDARRWQALAVCLVAGFMTLLDVSIVNVALPSIREGLHTTESTLQWVISGYALAFGLFLVPSGRLGDARGRRQVFMAGLALFTVASAACGAAQSSAWLVTARLVQGMAGGMISPQVSALIQQMFSGRERGRAFGMFGTVVGLSTAVGPLTGGLLIQAAGADEGWRWVFYVNLPLGIVCMLLAHRLLPDTPSAAPVPGKHANSRNLDPVGVALLGAGVVALLLPFVQTQQWHTDAKWLLLVAAAALLGIFTWWESRCTGGPTVPVVDVSLFRIRSYWLGCLLALVYFAGFTSIFFISTLYLQNGLHYTALQAGLALTPFALGSGAAAAVGGRLVHRYGRPLVAWGLAVVAVGLGGTVVAVHEVPGHDAGWFMMIPLLIAGLGSGLVIAPNQTLTLTRVPVSRGGSAGGVLQTGQRLGSAVGIAGVGALFFSRLYAYGAGGGGTGGGSGTGGAGQSAAWADAYQHGLAISVAFVVAALAAALGDIWASRGEPGEREKGTGTEAGTGAGTEAGPGPGTGPGATGTGA